MTTRQLQRSFDHVAEVRRDCVPHRRAGGTRPLSAGSGPSEAGLLATGRDLGQLAEPIEQPDHAHGVDGTVVEQGVAEGDLFRVEYGLNVGRYLQVPTFRSE